MTTAELATTENENLYRIPSANLEKLYQAIEQLNRRAKRNKLDPISCTEMGTEIVPAENDRSSYVVYLIQIIGKSPVLNGWKFLALIEHLDEGMTIIRAMPDTEITEGELITYRGCAPHCQHCKTQRYRKYTAVLKGQSSEYKQVGKNCLKDFTGHKSIEALAEIAEQLQIAISSATKYDEDGMSFGRGKSLIPSLEYLCYVAASIRLYGFISKKLQEESYETKISTSSDALNNMYPPRGHEPEYRPTQEDRAEAEKALSWIQHYKEMPLSDYLYNLSSVATLKSFDYKHLGIAASLINAYHRAIGKMREASATQESAWQGEPGKRLSIQNVYVKKLVTQESYYGYRNTYSYFYVLLDGKGNMYTYRSSNHLMEEGHTYNIVGTVKEYSEYRAVKQTVLTRCKVTSEVEQPAAV